MGLGPAAVKLNIELWQRGLSDGVRSVMDLGSQELQLPRERFFGLLASGGPPYNPGDFEPWSWPDFPRCSTRPFYRLLGLDKFDYIDLNGEHGALKIDLNAPLRDESLIGSYDLVTDYGTNEQVFNVAEAYRTMHRLAKVGGLLVNVQAVFRGNGYFLYDCSFFEELAQANGYEILFSSHIVTVPGEDGPPDIDEFHIPASVALLDVIDWSRVNHISICYVFRKVLDAEFSVPYTYGHGEDEGAAHGYRLQFTPQSPIRRYVPLAQPTMEETRTVALAGQLAKRVSAKAGSVIRGRRSR
jgi:hypothetical protein